MSTIDHHGILASKFGQLAPLLVSEKSIFNPRFWDRSNICVIDDSSIYTPMGNQLPQFGQSVRFVLPKRPTLVGPLMIEWVLSAAALPGLETAAYINNVGDAIARTVVMRYGGHVLQSYPGEFQQLVRRVSKHEVFEENRDQLTLGNRRYGANNGEAERAAAYEAGITLFTPLDELFFTHHFDEYWMPEALATEGEIEVTIADLARIVYSSTGIAPTVLPTLTSIRLRCREVTLTAFEKADRLKQFNADKGMLTHMLDCETQLRTPITGSLGALVPPLPLVERIIPLDNIRLDVGMLYFTVRKAATTDLPSVNRDWNGDPLDSDNSAAAPLVTSVVRAGTHQGTIVPISSFRLEANGSRLTGDIPEFLNRTWHRSMYFKESQSKDFVYFLSFQALPDNRKHVTGFLNAANLGKLQLVITLPDFLTTAPLEVDVFTHSHNIIQVRRGDAVKSLK